MNVKTAILLVTLTPLSGCGTINTVLRDDMVASNKLARWHSHCDSLPRIYSGAALGYCALNAEPRGQVGFDGHPSAALVALDVALSAVADTAVLPYTVYLQNKLGDIPKAQIN
ncbi:YceK/YidQ family lipoprotein [Pseudomonas sp. NUPR-001]|uniref:YceK/YidQ family lipoprotein n=1 Tax=Pseudomonas sp. NUPR-001 TaxID=3416058 RepID=UPI003F9DC08F